MRNRLAKIVATVGPASASPSMLRLLHNAGVDIYRLNMSHGGREKLKRVVEAIRGIEADAQTPISIFADLQGPKIRVGDFETGSIKLSYGDSYKLIHAESASDSNTIPIPHYELLSVLQQGDILKLDDGKLQVTVTCRDGDIIAVKADTPGELSNRKGVNLPGRALPISALTEKDRDDLEFALKLGVEYIALSFVQKPEDIIEAKKLINGRAGVIAKIEKPSAVEFIDEIIEETDAIMVARGGPWR